MMGFRRYYTAFGRFRRGRGFGIHSPFAFRFVLRVLKERNPYYAYSFIDEVCRAASCAGKKHVLAPKRAKMLFRITNYFNPGRILQIGCEPGGVSAMSAMAVSGKSELWLYGASGQELSDVRFLDGYAARVHCVDGLNGFDTPAFVVVSGMCDDCSGNVAEFLSLSVAQGAVVVFPDMRTSAEASLWHLLKSSMECGMSFDNGKTGVIVGDSKLPLHHYSLWF